MSLEEIIEKEFESTSLYEIYKRCHHDPLATGVSIAVHMNEMHKRILSLEDDLIKASRNNEVYRVENNDLTTQNKVLKETMKLCAVASEEILLENKKLKIEVEKVHSRFEILDL